MELSSKNKGLNIVISDTLRICMGGLPCEYGARPASMDTTTTVATISGILIKVA